MFLARVEHHQCYIKFEDFKLQISELSIKYRKLPVYFELNEFLIQHG